MPVIGRTDIHRVNAGRGEQFINVAESFRAAFGALARAFETALIGVGKGYDLKARQRQHIVHHVLRPRARADEPNGNASVGTVSEIAGRIDCRCVACAQHESRASRCLLNKTAPIDFAL